MTPDLAEKFVATFRRGIEAEKAALRQDSTAYEVALEQAARLTEMSQGQQHYYSFLVPRPSERLTAGVQCSLREPSGLEVPVTIVQLEGPRVILRTEVPISVSQAPYRLVFVPWFLYDEMAQALAEVAFPEVALRTFGKLPSQRQAHPPVGLDHALNDRQRAAVQQALESQLTILWGPPGTGKTTTLAELVSNLARAGRRVLITSTTHAALDQVLGRLVCTPALQPIFDANQVVQLGFSDHACSLEEVVNRTQHQARTTLQRTHNRLEQLRQLQLRLLPLLALAQCAAQQAQQLDLFAEPSGGPGQAELAAVFEPDRATRLAAESPVVQQLVLSRLARRLEFLLVGLKLRAREARQTLAQGQQQAVDESRILLTTLANSYVSPLLKNQHFDAVIVEEAGMALLPAVYLAAGRSRGQVILVGDPQQLPAILASRDPFAQQSLGRNIFAVLGERSERIMLDTQYRMHPTLGELVSRLFYGGALRHDPGQDPGRIAGLAPFPGHPLVVVDVAGQAMTEPGDYSRYNPASADQAVRLAAEGAARGLSVAVIAPYRKQVTLIQKRLEGQNLGQQVHCATVHRFQGQERDLVILDITDAPSLEPGVLLAGRGPAAASANLLNVSISRARGKLILLAHLEYVRARATGTVLHQLLEESVRRGWLTSATP